MHAQDVEQDAREILEFFVSLAHEDADRVAAFLQSAGFEPGTEIPVSVLIKLAVWCRLCRWETSGLTAQLAHQLPKSEEVFNDVLEELSGGERRWIANDLSLRVQRFQMDHLTWPQTSGARSFVLEDQSDPSEFLDSIAEFLWHHRDLAAPATNSLPAATGAISTPKSSVDADDIEQ
jgi:hypothetical protein